MLATRSVLMEVSMAKSCRLCPRLTCYYVAFSPDIECCIYHNCRIKLYYIVSYRIVSYRIVSYRIVSYRIISIACVIVYADFDCKLN